MAILTIITSENETLRKISKPVTDISPRMLQLIDDMKETLAKAGGVGLAAVQVGILRRIYIIDAGVEKDEHDFVVFINPEIVATSGTQEEIEGCLSVPGQYGITSRPAKVTVRATDCDGKTFTYTGKGIIARCLCHEYDHLDGILYTDKAIEMLDPEDVEEVK